MAKVASYGLDDPRATGTIAGVASAVSHAATGNWREAAWAAAGSLAAVVSAGAARPDRHPRHRNEDHAAVFAALNPVPPD